METEQFISEYEPEARSPFTTRTDVRTEGELRGRAYVDRVGEQAAPALSANSGQSGGLNRPNRFAMEAARGHGAPT